jgi:hypothetical protein
MKPTRPAANSREPNLSFSGFVAAGVTLLITVAILIVAARL